MMTLIKNISYRVIMLTSILLALMSGNDCSSLCGYIAPITYTQLGRRCPHIGFSFNNTYQINWSDGSYSNLNYNVSVQLTIGSCCSQLTSSAYATGIVTDGKFAGQPVILASIQKSNNEVCNECQTNSGLTSFPGTVLLSIGTKAVGQWIECSGTLTAVYSPILTSKPNPITYSTFAYRFTVCNTCVESC